ncbi:uncharacterized protein [Palaemon carinicauda]|uniref:uncharacterized protein n=1 Tax=Palaemon carinicauda TaxID=392227 RepID=UPI0035B67856
MKWLVFLVSVAALLAGTRGEDREDNQRLSNLEARIVAAYSTRTVLTLTTTTTTAVSTCNQAAGTNACQKRRIRRFSKLTNVNQEEDSSLVDLQSALEEVSESDKNSAAAGAARDGRIALTIWTTTSSTYTVTTTSTNTSTTFSVSYYCSIAGGNLFGSCG